MHVVTVVSISSPYSFHLLRYICIIGRCVQKSQTFIETFRPLQPGGSPTLLQRSKRHFLQFIPPKKRRKRASWRAMENWSHFLCSKQETHGTFGGPFMRPRIKEGDCSAVLHRRSPLYQTTAAPPPFILHFFSLFLWGHSGDKERCSRSYRNDQARSSKMMTFGGGQ